jgi:hypothetical protein
LWPAVNYLKLTETCAKMAQLRQTVTVTKIVPDVRFITLVVPPPELWATWAQLHLTEK